MENTCIMLVTPFYTPVDLRCIFDGVDLTGEGVVLDSHITIVFAKEQNIAKENILSDIITILGEEYDDFDKMLKNNEMFSVMDFFELDCFKGKESHYIILKMKKEGEGWEYLEKLNKALSRKYNIESDFDEYNPHITLAEILPGKSDQYLKSAKLKLILENSKFGVEDIIISHGDKGDWKQSHITNHHALDKFFREEAIKKNPIY